MTGRDFVEHYGSDDEEELLRVEQFHRDLENTLKHFVATRKQKTERVGRNTVKTVDPTVNDFIEWLEEKSDE